VARLIPGFRPPVVADAPISLDGLADAFNTSNQASVNIRSRTALARFDDRNVHLKTSDIDLGVEAAALRDGATLGHHDDVRSVSLIAFDAVRNLLMTGHADGESLFNVLWNRTSIWRSTRCLRSVARRSRRVPKSASGSSSRPRSASSRASSAPGTRRSAATSSKPSGGLS